jgi:hypothetical protein
MGELLLRRLVRTANAPAGDYAEFLVAKALNGNLEDNSVKSYDLTCAEFGKVQVKARVVSSPIKSSQRQTSPFRSDGFDYAAFVMLSNSDYRVVRAALVPRDVVSAQWTWRAHVNGHVVFMRSSLLNDPMATDITERLREAAEV